MPALKKTEIIAEVVWLGLVPDRDAALSSVAVPQAQLTYAGIPGEAHGGLTRPSCSRVISQHPRGTDIRNVRQLCVMSAEELALIAADCGVDHLDPAYAGASLVVRGIPDFTHLPPSSRLQFPDGSVIVIDSQAHQSRPPQWLSVLLGRFSSQHSPRHTR